MIKKLREKKTSFKDKKRNIYTLKKDRKCKKKKKKLLNTWF